MDDFDAVTEGPWSLSAHVETRAVTRYEKDQPPLEKGEALFRLVLELGYDPDWNDHTQCTGVEGTLTTGWCMDLYEAVRAAKRLTELAVEWQVYAEARDEYETRGCGLVLDIVVDEAVKRFEAAFPGVK